MLIGLAFFVLTVATSLSTPYRTPGILLTQRGPDGQPARVPDIGAPDERQHANYIAHLLDRREFPVLVPGSADLGETYQSHQPPLYYLLAAGWSILVRADPTDPAAGVKIRLLNAFFGLATLAGIFALGRAFGRDDVGLAASAIAGLMPMFVALHAAVSNDPLLIALCTWALAIGARALRDGWTLQRAIAFGLVAGLALLTKTSALALLPTGLLALLLARKWPAGSRVPVLVAVLLLPLLVAGPWLARNQRLYGDPLAMRAFNEAFVGSPKRQDIVRGLAAMREARGLSPAGATREYWVEWFGWWTLRSFYGAFGYMDIFWPAWLYRALALVTGVLIAAAIAGAIRSRDGPAEDPVWPVAAMSFGFLLVMALLYLQFNLTYFQAQARYLYPAIAPIALALAFGACFALGRFSRWAWLALGVALLVLDLYSLKYLRAEFRERTLASSGTAPYVAGSLARERANTARYRNS